MRPGFVPAVARHKAGPGTSWTNLRALLFSRRKAAPTVLLRASPEDLSVLPLSSDVSRSLHSSPLSRHSWANFPSDPCFTRHSFRPRWLGETIGRGVNTDRLMRAH